MFSYFLRQKIEPHLRDKKISAAQQRPVLQGGQTCDSGKLPLEILIVNITALFGDLCDIHACGRQIILCPCNTSLYTILMEGNTEALFVSVTVKLQLSFGKYLTVTLEGDLGGCVYLISECDELAEFWRIAS